jgi:hypothetical protein
VWFVDEILCWRSHHWLSGLVNRAGDLRASIFMRSRLIKRRSVVYGMLGTDAERDSH